MLYISYLYIHCIYCLSNRDLLPKAIIIQVATVSGRRMVDHIIQTKTSLSNPLFFVSSRSYTVLRGIILDIYIYITHTASLIFQTIYSNHQKTHPPPKKYLAPVTILTHSSQRYWSLLDCCASHLAEHLGPQRTQRSTVNPLCVP